MSRTLLLGGHIVVDFTANLLALDFHHIEVVSEIGLIFTGRQFGFHLLSILRGQG